MTAIGVSARRRPQRVPPARAFAAACGLLLAALLIVFVASNVVASIGQRSLRVRFDRVAAAGFAAAPRAGDPVADLAIPSIGLDAIVAEGPSSERRAPVHLPNTAPPGFSGLSAIEAGRLGYGAFFGSIDRLQIGDEIDVRSAAGVVRYTVTQVGTVDASAVDLSSTGDDQELVLIAPASRLGGSLRIVVHAAAAQTTGSSQ